MKRLFFAIALVAGTHLCIAQCDGYYEMDAPGIASINYNSVRLTWPFHVNNSSSYIELRATDGSWYIPNQQINASQTESTLSLQSATLYTARVVVNWGCSVPVCDPSDDPDCNGRAEGIIYSPARSFWTQPDLPTYNVSACSATTTSITVAWNRPAGEIHGYLVDISTHPEFPQGSYVVQNEDIEDENTPIYTHPGLTPGTNYYYQVRAYNASGTANRWQEWETVPVIPTLTLKPQAQGASDIRGTSFKANWNAPTGIVNHYRMDVATNEAFTAPLILNNVQVNGTSKIVEGLTAGTRYYYRIRAVNSSGPSANSEVIQILTVPAAPTALDVSSVTASSFRLDWFAPPSATHYDIYVARDQNFTDPVTGYNPKVVTTTFETVAGLSASTRYYVKFRARNAPLSSQNPGSELVTRTVVTLAAGSNPLALTNLVSPDKHTTNDQQTISVRVERAIGPVVTFYHKRAADTRYTSEVIMSVGDRYEVTVADSWLDEFGMNFYFEATDETFQKAYTNSELIKTSIPMVTVPLSRFGKETKNYQIISVPYTLDQTHIRDIFERVMGSYDRKKWRIVQYRDGDNVDFDGGLASENLVQGQGYWFISASEVTLDIGAGVSFGNSTQKSFLLNLKAGWNQIGNPFPFDLSWQSVLDANDNPEGVGKLVVFDSDSFVEDDILKVFGGGFVFADEEVQILFTVGLPRALLRKSTETKVDLLSEVSLLHWMLPIELQQGDVKNRLAGIGMHPQADNAKDPLDRVTLPRLDDYLEFNSRHTGYPYSFSRDVVRSQSEYTWHYNLQSSGDRPVTLRWNSAVAANLAGQLILYDQTNHTVLDMAGSDTYTTTPNSQISIHLTPERELDVFRLELGKAYPNPFTDQITIPFDFLKTKTSSAITTIYDLAGKVIWQGQSVNNTQDGIRSITWDGIAHSGKAVSPGLYLYTVVVQGETEKATFQGKILKR